MQNLARQIEYGPSMWDTSPLINVVSGSKATTGPTTLITGVANKQIVIESITLQAEADGDQTMLLANTAGTIFQRLFVTTKAQGLARSKLRWPQGSGHGVSLSLSAALQVGYTIHYYFEDV